MFARLLGISEKTLQNWEQGRRKPTGPAKVLLRVAARHPKLLLETVRYKPAWQKGGDALKVFHVVQQLLISEVSLQLEPLLREVWNYLNFLKSQAAKDGFETTSLCPGFGTVPGIKLAEDFDAPLDAFAGHHL
jgi:transcriptional regulator with XRE-family HTH domain